jgi:hypothetical protein
VRTSLVALLVVAVAGCGGAASQDPPAPLTVVASASEIPADGITSATVTISNSRVGNIVVSTSLGILETGDGQSGTSVTLAQDGTVALRSACDATVQDGCWGRAWISAKDAALAAGGVRVDLTCEGSWCGAAATGSSGGSTGTGGSIGGGSSGGGSSGASEFDWVWSLDQISGWEMALSSTGEVSVVGSTIFERVEALSCDANSYVLLHFAVDGSLAWSKCTSASEPIANHVIMAPDGSATVEGSYSAAHDFGGGVTLPDPGSAVSPRFVARYASDGTVQWARAYDYWAENHIAGTPDGAMVVASSSYGNPDVGGAHDFVMKVSPVDGTPSWVKVPPTELTIRDVTVDGDGDVIVLLTYPFGPPDFGAGALPIAPLYLAKYAAADGALLWAKAYGNGHGLTSSYGVKGVRAGAGGHIVIGGWFSNGPVDLGGGVVEAEATLNDYLAEFDGEGTFRWMTVLREPGFAGCDYVPVADMAVLPDGSLYAVGSVMPSGDSGAHAFGTALPRYTDEAGFLAHFDATGAADEWSLYPVRAGSLTEPLRASPHALAWSGDRLATAFLLFGPESLFQDIQLMDGIVVASMPAPAP